VAELVSTEASLARGPAGHALEMLCKFFAVISGLVLTAMALMSIFSIGGRSLLGSPIVGDYELVQAMCALAVSMALPYTHWIKAHVIVDFFTAHAPAALNTVLDTVAHLLLATLAGVIAWRMAVAVPGLRESLDASMLLSIPTWWIYLPMVASFALLSAVALYGAGGAFQRSAP
jgi:TRAP-type C4-dicarboxylate transport system permease small subunit